MMTRVQFFITMAKGSRAAKETGGTHKVHRDLWASDDLITNMQLLLTMPKGSRVAKETFKQMFFCTQITDKYPHAHAGLWP